MGTNPDVDAWFTDYDHPANDAMPRLREFFLSQARMTETVTWKSPTFLCEGPMANLDPRTRAHVGLMFHTGASIPGDHPLLQGGGATAGHMTIAAAVEAAAPRLEAVAAAWCESRG